MSLSDLPSELIVQIGSYLEVPDLANLSGVNKRISSIIDKSNILWKHSLKHFGLNCDPYIERMIRGNFDKLFWVEMGTSVLGNLQYWGKTVNGSGYMGSILPILLKFCLTIIPYFSSLIPIWVRWFMVSLPAMGMGLYGSLPWRFQVQIWFLYSKSKFS